MILMMKMSIRRVMMIRLGLTLSKSTMKMRMSKMIMKMKMRLMSYFKKVNDEDAALLLCTVD